MEAGALNRRRRRFTNRDVERLFIRVPPLARLAGRTAVILFYIAVVCLAMLSDGPAEYTAARVFAVGLMLLISCWPLLFSMRGVGVLHPLFFLSAYGFVKGTALDLYWLAMGVDSHPALPTAQSTEILEIQIQIILLICVGWLMTYGGFRIARGVSWRRLQFIPKPQLEIWGSAASYIIGVIAFYLLANLSGGFAGHLKNIARGFGEKVYVINPEYASMYAFLVTLTMLAPAILMLRNQNASKSPWFWLLSIGSVLLLFLVNGRRSAVLRPILLFLTCWMYSHKKVPIARISIIGMLVVLGVGVVGEYRRSNWSSSNEVSFDAVRDLTIENAFQLSIGEIQSRRSGGPMYPIVYKVPSRESFLYGVNYLDYAKRFIPRALWPDKPRGIGIDCARIFYGVGYAIPPGPYGEAYWSGGALGVAVVFFLWGMILKSLAKFFLAFHESPIACLLYLMTLAMLTPDETGFRSWLFLFAPSVSLLFATGMVAIRSGR